MKKELSMKFHPSLNGISYANAVFINNSSEEFLFDFGNVTPGKDGVEIFSRIALSPRNAKMLLLVLSERVEGYEGHFGEIVLPSAEER